MKILISLLSFTLTLFAHPHVFVDVYPKIGKDTIQLRWVFDEMTSNMLIMDYDVDRDNAFSPAESEVLGSDIFASLKEHDYYTYFFKGEAQLPTGEARDFGASIQGAQLVFTFTLPRPAEAETVRFFDWDNMTAYQVTEAFVREVNSGHSFKVYEHDYDYYYGYVLELK
ncbi:DUF1007 family protein [Sulfurovum sp.]|jgi:ABC-type uncharacterized transport system substrate-binding protein|uniref:DUF1007 family protein n=1 Tax=Sulfurovum sp. TaxID=1969726 RepID=UPI002A3588E7|nr:DUF1007 family protein [Sulfurovum sp.]MDY0403564.1 DUF1007 family protein [Sulfurovum sp.]